MAIVPKFTATLSLSSGTTHGKFLWSLWSSLQQPKSTRVDQIDSFTNELIQKKSLKWDIVRDAALLQKPSRATTQNIYEGVSRVAKNFSRDLQAIRKPDLCIDIRTLNHGQLDSIISGIIDDGDEQDFLYVVRQCLLYRTLPSTEVLPRLLDYLVTIREVRLVDEMAIVCQEKSETFYKNNSRLLPYKALALWRSENVKSALQCLLEGYRLECKNRRSLRETFRTIASETIGAKSEAVLITLVKAADEIHRDFNEIFVIACVWRSTFASQWFSDQQIARQMFDEYEELRTMVCKKSSSLCHNFLTCHDVDAAHRLIELFLKYNHKDACSSCLKMLFNYQYWRRDLRACSEIAQFCLDIDRALPEIETQKLLNLLLNRPSKFYKQISQSECSNKFQYKF